MNHDHRYPLQDPYIDIYDNRKQYDGMMIPQITGNYHMNLRFVNPEECLAPCSTNEPSQ